jgi:hypothetical protein
LEGNDKVFTAWACYRLGPSSQIFDFEEKSKKKAGQTVWTNSVKKRINSVISFGAWV